ncbi:MAG: hypothetical protein WD607_10115 [Candidatus Paceibacterota bacterium]
MAKRKKIILIITTVIILVLLVYLVITNKLYPDVQNLEESVEEDVIFEEENIITDDTTTGFINTPEDGNDEFTNLDEDSQKKDVELADKAFNVRGTIASITSDYFLVDTNGSHMDDGNPVQVQVNIVEDSYEDDPNDPGDQILVPGTEFLDINYNKVSQSYFTVSMVVYIDSRDNIKNQTEFDVFVIKEDEFESLSDTKLKD